MSAALLHYFLSHKTKKLWTGNQHCCLHYKEFWKKFLSKFKEKSFNFFFFISLYCMWILKICLDLREWCLNISTPFLWGVPKILFWLFMWMMKFVIFSLLHLLQINWIYLSIITDETRHNDHCLGLLVTHSHHFIFFLIWKIN